jgi:hypothetical protein
MGSVGDMNFLLGKINFDELLSYLTGGIMPYLFPKLYKVELRKSLSFLSLSAETPRFKSQNQASRKGR